MNRLTLREAAERTSRSVTTLRRYIRSGRLRAEKRLGRFGPEYFVSFEDLADAGLDELGTDEANGNDEALTPVGPRAPASRDAVPLTLFQELQMKHEQLLVQYGMVRAAGVQVIGLRDELERLRAELDEREQALAHERQRSQDERSRLTRELHRANLELEGRGLELAALREKVRGLEMLTRNSVTSESIEQQYRDLVVQSRRVEKLSRAGQPAPWRPAHLGPDKPDADH